MSILLFVFNDYYLYVSEVLQQAVPDNLGPYWSLSLEEQFYFVFPFLLFFVPKRTLLVAGFIALIAVQFFLDRTVPMGNALWPNRLDTLMWGVVIACFQRTIYYRIFEPVSLRHRTVAAAVSVLLIFLIALAVEALHEMQIATGLVSLLCAIFVWLASYSHGYVIPVRRPLGKVLEWIGSHSYTLYLVHMPAYLLTRYVWLKYTDLYLNPESKPAFTIPMILSALFLMGLLSELTYRLVERPLRNKGRRLSEAFLAKAGKEFVEVAPDNGRSTRSTS